MKKFALALTLATAMASAPAVAQTAPQTPNLSVEAISSQSLGSPAESAIIVAGVVIFLLLANAGCRCTQ